MHLSAALRIQTLARCLLAALTILFIITSCTSSSKSASTDSNATYSRVVSLVPSITQCIYELEAQDILIGCTSFCVTNPEDSIPVVSTAVKPNIELIVSLKPELVLVSGLISDKDIETLQRFNIRVERFGTPKSFEEICEQFTALGEATGKSEKAKGIIGQANQRIEELSQSASAEKPKIFMQIGASPIFAVIAHTFMDDYIALSGGTNIAGELESPTVGREFVVSSNPDYIFIVTMGPIGEDELTEWGRFTQMSATVHQRIFTIDSAIACQPTPTNFIKTLEIIKRQMTE